MAGYADRQKKNRPGGRFFELVGRPAGFDQAQEKPDLLEQPERAPEGIEEEPELIRKPAAEMVFWTLVPPHLAHFISWWSLLEVESTSKTFLHSRHLYS